MHETTKKLSNTFRAKMDSLLQPNERNLTAKNSVNFIKQILHFHHSGISPMLLTCRETLTGQVSLIMKLLEM